MGVSNGVPRCDNDETVWLTMLISGWVGMRLDVIMTLKSWSKTFTLIGSADASIVVGRSDMIKMASSFV